MGTALRQRSAVMPSQTEGWAHSNVFSRSASAPFAAGLTNPMAAFALEFRADLNQMPAANRTGGRGLCRGGIGGWRRLAGFLVHVFPAWFRCAHGDPQRSKGGMRYLSILASMTGGGKRKGDSAASGAFGLHVGSVEAILRLQDAESAVMVRS